MKYAQRNMVIALLAITLLSVPLFFLNVRDIHNWGDDYAMYIKEAQNISAGIPYYQTTYIYNNQNPEYAPPSYPPGFPLVLAPVVKFFGMGIRPMLYLVSFFTACLFFALFFFFKKYMGLFYAVCLAFVGAYSGYVIDLKASVLADIPLTFFITLYLVLRHASRFSAGRIIALILTAVAAMLVKSQGIILLAAEGVYFAVELTRNLFQTKRASFSDIRDATSLKVIFGSAAIYLLLMKVAFYAPSDSWGFYTRLFARNQGKWLSVIARNFIYLIKQLKNIFRYQADQKALRVLAGFFEYAGFAFFLVGVYKSFRKKIAFADVFFVMMCIMILCLSVYEGLRYLLPVIGVYLLYCCRGLRCLSAWLPLVKKRVVLLAAVLVLLIAGTDEFRHALSSGIPWNPYSGEDSTAFRYIIQQVPDTEIIAFSKPRALALYTRKRTMILGQVPAAENRKRFDSMKVQYMLIKEGVDEAPFRRYLADARPEMDSVAIAPKYVLYRFR